jgi:hypothetical protein
MCACCTSVSAVDECGNPINPIFQAGSNFKNSFFYMKRFLGRDVSDPTLEVYVCACMCVCVYVCLSLFVFVFVTVRKCGVCESVV